MGEHFLHFLKEKLFKKNLLDKEILDPIKTTLWKQRDVFCILYSKITTQVEWKVFVRRILRCVYLRLSVQWPLLSLYTNISLKWTSTIPDLLSSLCLSATGLGAWHGPIFPSPQPITIKSQQCWLQRPLGVQYQMALLVIIWHRQQLGDVYWGTSELHLAI